MCFEIEKRVFLFSFVEIPHGLSILGDFETLCIFLQGGIFIINLWGCQAKIISNLEYFLKL